MYFGLSNTFAVASNRALTLLRHSPSDLFAGQSIYSWKRWTAPGVLFIFNFLMVFYERLVQNLKGPVKVAVVFAVTLYVSAP